jgi:DNA-binding GntR family transcriptional regulator
MQMATDQFEQGVSSESRTPESNEGGYERLRNAILHGELEPGEIYSQAQLSQILDLSRTPLREAIRRVQSEKLLEVERHRRLRVAPLDPADLEQLYAMRVLLESLGVRLTVPKLSADEITRIRATLDAHEQACAERDLERARALHRDFHFGLFAHCGDRLVDELQELWDHAQRYRRLYLQGRADEIGLLQMASRDHEVIFEAAAAGEAEKAAEASAKHMSHIALTLFAHLEGNPEPRDIRAAMQMTNFGPTD